MAYPTSGTRTSYVGSEAIGDTVTKTNLDAGPGGLVTYQQITADSAVFGSAGGAQQVLAATFGAPAGRMFVIEIGCWGIATTGAGGAGTETTEISIWDMNAVTCLGSVAITNQFTVGTNWPGRSTYAWHQPSAGNQTYAFRIQTTPNAGTSTTQIFASPSNGRSRNAYLMVRDVGPAF